MSADPPLTAPLLPKFGQTGLSLGALAVGCATLGGAYGEVDEAEVSSSVAHAIDAGVGYFDTSPYYGDSELILGRALQSCARPRDSYVVAT